ncbi:MAG: hypothetical protein JSS28_11685 [Proteobacteria bacterium]|nr:hypothetical protein [Pseudomonadota bacterium]
MHLDRARHLPDFRILLAGILAVTAAVYWPVWHAGFVWVDRICFYDNAWLRYGDEWKHFIFRNFYDWTNYFRPLVVALFVAEVRGFDVHPGPMHAVSLLLHLANTALVALLARRLVQTPPGAARRHGLTALATLIYALHPALIEPVVWVSSQFELVVNFFILLALLCNLAIRGSTRRAVAVSACFFLAACAKESAVALPLLLVVFDGWRTQPTAAAPGVRAALRRLWQRQWPVYLGVLVAGIAYLALRAWALGTLVHANGRVAMFSLGHLQTVACTYLMYWRILVWPMVGLGPMHVVDTRAFAALSAQSLLVDGAAATIALGGLFLTVRRKAVGILIVAVSAALLPVLHIVPIEFDESLYHERYAMTAIAIGCALLPASLAGIDWRNAKIRPLAFAAGAAAAFWLALALVNIRITLPLWADETKLWLWVLRENPDSIVAMNHLLSTYIQTNDKPHARELADVLLARKPPCPMCMINIANLAFADDDPARAAAALDEARRTIGRANNARLVQAYILATGQLREMRGDATGAEEAYRDAITMEPMDPEARMNLALLYARHGRAAQARQAYALAIPLFAPAGRPAQERYFQQVLAAAAAAEPSAPAAPGDPARPVHPVY